MAPILEVKLGAGSVLQARVDDERVAFVVLRDNVELPVTEIAALALLQMTQLKSRGA